MALIHGAFCVCPPLFNGTFCEKAINGCNNNPCQNNGACVPMNGGYSCICTKDYTGPNCERQRSSCGGVLDSEAGILQFPLINGTTYTNNVTCVWLITNSNAIGKVLNITFTKFNVEQSVNCAFDYVDIFDGPALEYKMLGRYCGYKLPMKTGTFVSSFNSVLIRFRSDISVSSDGFELNWITVEPSKYRIR